MEEQSMPKWLPMHWINQLFIRFEKRYETKWTSKFRTDAAVKMAQEDWAKALAGVSADQIRGALEHCYQHLEWPPTPYEFRLLCERNGEPSEEEIMQKIIRREFDHPLHKMIFDWVGSWAFRNDKEADLRKKVKNAYAYCIAEYRQNPAKHLAKFQELHSLNSTQLPHEKAATVAEDHMQKIINHPTWDKKKITRGSKEFDAIEEQNRKDYLLSLKELYADTLPRDDWYDRVRYLRQQEASISLPVPSYAENKTPRQGSPKHISKTVFRDWAND